MIKYSIALIIFLISNIYAQQNNNVVAESGPVMISKSEFTARFETSPFLSQNYDYHQLDSLKLEFLYSLLAEKILAEQAKSDGLDTTLYFKLYFKPVEDILLRDALFKKEVENNISISAEELNSAVEAAGTELLLRYFSFSDSSDAYNAYNKLSQIGFRDTVYNFSGSYFDSVVTVTFGSMRIKEIEQQLYSLSLNEHTKPLNTPAGWVIFALTNKRRLPVDISDEKVMSDIKKIIRDRKAEQLHNEYLFGLLKNKTIDISSPAFNKISKVFREYIYPRLSANPAEKVVLDENEISLLMTKLGSDLDMILFSLDVNDYTIRDYFAYLLFDGYNIDNISSADQKLLGSIKQFIHLQLITEEARRQNLENQPGIKQEIESWKANYLSQLLKNKLLVNINISDIEVEAYYKEKLNTNLGMTLADMYLLISDNLDTVSTVLSRHEQGIPFPDILRASRTKNIFTNEFGRTGLVPLLSLGELGRYVDEGKVGEVTGPVTIGNVYAVFQLIEKKKSNDSLEIPFEQVDKVLRNELLLEKLENILTEKIIDYAQNNKIKINEDLLSNTNVSNIPMFTHRLMGFGGRISSVPVTSPWTQWLNMELIKKEIVF